MSFTVPCDFYYKDLPPYYPPLYFYLLAQYARIFAIEAYQALKIGSLLCFALLPPLLSYFWSKLVSRFQAACVTVVTMTYHAVAVFAVPHEFIANVIFIPWWLYFVQDVNRRKISVGFYIVGGLIGAVVFMTYYYAFFVGALVLVYQGFKWSLTALRDKSMRTRLSSSFIMLAGSAVFSSVYWLPLLLSMMINGSTPHQNHWFNPGYAQLNFSFLEYSTNGLIFLLSIVYLLRRLTVESNRQLLLLIAAVPVYYLIGCVLGNVDSPVLYIKANEFLNQLAGAVIGLTAAALIRLGFRSRKWKYVLCAGLPALLLVFMSDFTDMMRGRAVEVARKAKAEKLFTMMRGHENIRESVFLSSVSQLPAFWPSFMFISPNEHYSHPAARFDARLAFLESLESEEDPTVFAAALRHNVYDAVDYIMPGFRGHEMEIQLNRSDYPHGLKTRLLRFKKDLIYDTTLFSPRRGGWYYAVTDSGFEGRSILIQERAALLIRLREHLTDSGRTILTRYAGDPECWNWQEQTDSFRFADQLLLTRYWRRREEDSLRFVFELKVLRDIEDSYRIYFHLYPGVSDSFQNFDFSPATPTTEWRVDHRVYVSRAIPASEPSDRIHFGFFTGKRRMDSAGCWLEPVIADSKSPDQ